MSWESFIPALALMTLGAGIAFAATQMVFFLRKRSNREATKRGLLE
jgi:hypothetical protein